MQIVHDEADLRRAMAELSAAGTLGREGGLSAERPVLVDRFLDDAVEVDVDAIRDATGAVVIGGVMEHVEQAGVHSGDSACAIPPQSLSPLVLAQIEDSTKRIAHALDVRGLINVQYAVRDGKVYVLEANPRASRTVPFVAKATGVPLAMVASRVMLGATLEQLRAEGLLRPPVSGGHVSVKEAVLPFSRFPDVDPVLSPEMRSTGEVMGIDATFGLSYAKSQMAASNRLPAKGAVFVSVADADKPSAVPAARAFFEAGLTIVATAGTAAFLEARGVPVATVVRKLVDDRATHDGQPTAVDLIADGGVALVVNTPRGSGSHADGAHIRRAATQHKVPVLTTVAAALAAAAGMHEWADRPFSVRSLQEWLTADQQTLVFDGGREPVAVDPPAPRPPSPSGGSPSGLAPGRRPGEPDRRPT